MQETKVLETVASLQQVLTNHREEGKTIGFVPTMGALHDGHISLVQKAHERADIVVVSIFVNPTQFNNASDLDKYPRTVEQDVALLSKAKVRYAFVPNVDEIYPADSVFEPINIGSLGEVMEGEFRPGHFNGVIQVVKRLFEIVQPDVACFGRKDFQQLAVINFMTKYFDLPIEIIGCDIKREDSGLAMSSRNMRLTESEKLDALHIYQTLKFALENVKDHSPSKLKEMSSAYFSTGNLTLEYLDVVDPNTLLPLTEWVDGATICIACFCGDVRLIDNLQLI